jgi:hypothetical protein
MPDRITLDVVDRPAGGVLGALKRARATRRARPDGMRALFALGTARLAPRVRPALTPRRIALLAAWEEGAEGWSGALGELAHGAGEHWHVEAEVVRAAFSRPWRGWTPDAADARPLDSSEPALILISGELRARYATAFARDSAGAVGHALGRPGYLGGLAIASSPLNTTSCSCWRTYAEARGYAFGPGGHRDAVQRDRARGQHRTEYFLRLRPLLERGTLDGSARLGHLVRVHP